MSDGAAPGQILTRATPRSASHAGTLVHPSGSRHVQAVTAALETMTHGELVVRHALHQQREIGVRAEIGEEV